MITPPKTTMSPMLKVWKEQLHAAADQPWLFALLMRQWARLFRRFVQLLEMVTGYPEALRSAAWLIVLSLITVSCTTAQADKLITPSSTSTPTTIPVEVEPSAVLPQEMPTPTISAEASAYLNEALDIMQNNSINRDTVDWEKLREMTYLRATYGRGGAAQETSDTYEAIGYALAIIGDNHSNFARPAQVAQWVQAEGGAFPEPEGKLVAEKLGYITVPPIGSGNQALTEEYALQVQTLIQELDAQSPCGWMVDLRQNIGGNMWPMLAGIGPVLGDGPAGAFVDPDGQMSEWGYAKGESLLDGEVQVQVPGEPYPLTLPDPPVAVLIGPLTISSGEAIAVAFQGRANTRSFGLPTYGLSTGNSGFPLSDGAMLFLTTVTFADRTGRLYGHELTPDEIVLDAVSTVQDEGIDLAAQWLLEQPACANSR